MEGVLSGLAERRFVGNTGLRRLVTGVCRAEERVLESLKLSTVQIFTIVNEKTSFKDNL